MWIYLVKHAYRTPDMDEDVFETKTIGVFSNEKKAKEAIAKLRPMEGFADYPDGFSIEDYEVDVVEWDTGFASGTPISRPPLDR